MGISVPLQMDGAGRPSADGRQQSLRPGRSHLVGTGHRRHRHGARRGGFPRGVLLLRADDRVLSALFPAGLYSFGSDDPIEPESGFPDAGGCLPPPCGTAGAVFRQPSDRRHHQPHLLRHRHGQRLPFQRSSPGSDQCYHRGGIPCDDAGHIADAGSRLRRDDPHFHPFYPVYDPQGASAFPQTLAQARRTQRLCGRNHHRTENDQGLPPGTDHDRPFRRQKQGGCRRLLQRRLLREHDRGRR